MEISLNQRITKQITKKKEKKKKENEKIFFTFKINNVLLSSF